MERPDIFDDIAYRGGPGRDWKLCFRSIPNGEGVLYWSFMTHDSKSYATVVIRSRKWLINDNMTDEELVGTAWMAVKAAIEHEAAEFFYVGDILPFDPHSPKLVPRAST